MSSTDQPIAENEQVKELLALLQKNKTPGYEDFVQMIGYVTVLENRLATAIEDLTAMREDLQKMQNNSLKASLQNTCKSLEANIAAMQEKLAELKRRIVEGCKNILDDFKARGTVALNGIAQFFHLKPLFEAIRQGAENSQQRSNQAMECIDAFAAEYHETGKHLKNMRLALMGKEPIQEAKTAGAITQIVKAPYRASRACMGTIRKTAEKAAGALERLAQAARERSSVIQAMREQKAKAAPPKKKDAPAKTQTER